MKLMAFDIETDRLASDTSMIGVGISCAMFYDGVEFYTFAAEKIKMTPQELADMVRWVVDKVNDGWHFVTVNGTRFDFQVLATNFPQAKGLLADVAMNNHVDLMLYPLCKKGWPVGLEAFAKEAGLGKAKQVRLSNGVIVKGMSGEFVPELWRMGEREAVLLYLSHDVIATLGVANEALRRGRLEWRSGNGRKHSLKIGRDRLETPAELLSYPEPDRSWMDKPMTNQSIVDWMGIDVKSLP